MRHSRGIAPGPQMPQGSFALAGRRESTGHGDGARAVDHDAPTEKSRRRSGTLSPMKIQIVYCTN